MRDFLFNHVWPFKLYRELETSNRILRAEKNELELMNNLHKDDLDQICKFMTSNGIAFKKLAPENTKPIPIYYAASVKRGHIDSSSKIAEVEYIYAEPKMNIIGETTGHLDLRTNHAKNALVDSIFKGITNILEKDLKKEIAEVLFKK